MKRAHQGENYLILGINTKTKLNNGKIKLVGLTRHDNAHQTHTYTHSAYAGFIHDVWYALLLRAMSKYCWWSTSKYSLVFWAHNHTQTNSFHLSLECNKDEFSRNAHSKRDLGCLLKLSWGLHHKWVHIQQSSIAAECRDQVDRILATTISFQFAERCEKDGGWVEFVWSVEVGSILADARCTVTVVWWEGWVCASGFSLCTTRQGSLFMVSMSSDSYVCAQTHVDHTSSSPDTLHSCTNTKSTAMGWTSNRIAANNSSLLQQPALDLAFTTTTNERMMIRAEKHI